MVERVLGRNQRRAAHFGNGESTSDDLQHDAAKIPLTQPDHTGPKGKTLFELAQERQAQIKGRAGSVSPRDKTADFQNDGEEDSAIVVALLYGVTLSMVHFTFDVLVYHQYAQEIEWQSIINSLCYVLPIFCVIVYLLHMDLVMRFAHLRQCFFFGTSCFVGCYLVKTTNEEPYIAVMKGAPPLGSLWVWTVIELKRWYALANIAVVASYLWWNHYSLI